MKKDQVLSECGEPLYAMTQEAIAKELGISRSRVGQLQKSGLEKLRKALAFYTKEQLEKAIIRMKRKRGAK